MTAGAQARLFLSQLRGAVAPGENAYLPAVIDVEMQPNDVSSAANYVAGVQELDLDGRGRSAFRRPQDDHLHDGELLGVARQSRRLRDHPLWVADYGQDPPRLPNGWSSYAFFQKAQDGTVNGIAGKIDVDFFNGDIDVLTAMTTPLTA